MSASHSLSGERELQAPPLFQSGGHRRALKRAGLKRARKSKSSHQSYRRVASGKTYTATVPAGEKEIPRGTLENIIRQAGLTPTQFLGHLRKRR